LIERATVRTEKQSTVKTLLIEVSHKKINQTAVVNAYSVAYSKPR